MLNTGLLVILICLSTFTNAAAQTGSSCNADGIMIKDPVSGSVQCQDCLKCPAGEGLSVKCGDFIDSQTPLVCKPCVLGETYSSAYEAGACKDCEKCGPYRETIKPCTLTSKAVCGKCKVGAYEEPMLSMCKPCSPCCNDSKDIVISQCQVPGIPANKQCSFARSAKCSKVASVSTVAPIVETNHSRLQSTISSTVTSHAVNSAPSEPSTRLVRLPYDASPSQTKFVAGSVLGGVFVVFILPLAFVIHVMVKRRKARKQAVDDLALAETAPGERPQQVQDNNQPANAEHRDGADHPKSALPVQEETTVPVQESVNQSQDKTGIQDTTPPHHPDTGESSVNQSQDKTGIQDTKPPRHPDTDFKLFSTILDHPGPTSELHSYTKESGRNTTVQVIVDVTSSVEPVRF